MPPTDVLDQMPPFQGVPCVRMDTGAECAAMILPRKFRFRLPDILNGDGRKIAEGGWVRGEAGFWLVQLDEFAYTVLPNEAVVTRARFEALRAEAPAPGA